MTGDNVPPGGEREEIVQNVVAQVQTSTEARMQEMLQKFQQEMMNQFGAMLNGRQGNTGSSVPAPIGQSADQVSHALLTESLLTESQELGDSALLTGPASTANASNRASSTPDGTVSSAGQGITGSSEMRMIVRPHEPPAFASTNKPYMLWRREILNWKQMMDLNSFDKRQLAYKVISTMDLGNNLEGSKLKSIVMRKMDSQLFNTGSFERLLRILDEENLGEAVKMKLTLWWRLVDLKRDPFVDFKTFLNDFDTAATELEAAEVKLDPVIKSGILLKAIMLPDQEHKIVLSSIDQKAEDIYKEVRSSIESVILNQLALGNDNSQNSVNTLLARRNDEHFKEEVWRQAHVLAANTSNWNNKKHKISKRKADDKDENVKRKNRTEYETGLPMKCFKCRCDCTAECDHDCIFHLADRCPKKPKKNESGKPKDNSVKANLLCPSTATGNIPLWISYNVFFQGEFGGNSGMSILDCGCPTTAVGTKWIQRFSVRAKLKEIDLQRQSSKTKFVFGDGVEKPSRGLVFLSLVLGEKLRVNILAESAPPVGGEIIRFSKFGEEISSKAKYIFFIF